MGETPALLCYHFPIGSTNQPEPIERGTKMKRKESQFSKDINKALTKEMLKRNLNPNAVAFILRSYDFESYLLEGTLSHIEGQIRAAASVQEGF
jgi:hypothetical protein